MNRKIISTFYKGLVQLASHETYYTSTSYGTLKETSAKTYIILNRSFHLLTKRRLQYTLCHNNIFLYICQGIGSKGFFAWS